MTQPKYAPVPIGDEVRPFSRLEVPPPWRAHRPGDLDERGRRVATPAGPDQGYLALFVERYRELVVLGEGEYLDDVIAGAVAIGMARAATFGRAPVGADLQYALAALGYLAPLAPELLARRLQLVGGVAHDLWLRGRLADAFGREMLAMTPEEAGAAELWRHLGDPEPHAPAR